MFLTSLVAIAKSKSMSEYVWPMAFLTDVERKSLQPTYWYLEYTWLRTRFTTVKGKSMKECVRPMALQGLPFNFF